MNDFDREDLTLSIEPWEVKTLQRARHFLITWLDGEADEDMDAQGHQYEVIAGNIGSVYQGPDVVMARQHYTEYVEQSRAEVGRAGGESVTLMQDGKPLHEFYGKNKS